MKDPIIRGVIAKRVTKISKIVNVGRPTGHEDMRSLMMQQMNLINEQQSMLKDVISRLKKLEQPDDPEAHGYNKKVMRYSSTYRHTGLIGQRAFDAGSTDNLSVVAVTFSAELAAAGLE